MAAHSTLLALFAKPPVPGKSKSRLAAAIGTEAAAALSAAMLEDVVRIATGIPEVAVELHYAPDSSPEDFPEPIQRMVKVWQRQRGADLGARMQWAFEQMLQKAASAIIVGSDCIAVTRGVLEEAAKATRDSDLVLQPADDGGYTLIASSRVLPAVFRDVQWGTASVLEQTVERAKNAEISVRLLAGGFDVDEIEDLEKLARFCAREPRPATMRWLDAYRRQTQI